MNNTYFKQAIRGIKSSPSRTLLTTLGIMIGIGTVILVLSAGEGFKSYINSQVEAFGTNTIFIETSVPVSTKDRSSSSSSSSGQANSSAMNAVPITTLKTKDINDIKNLPNVANAYGAAIGQEVVTYKGVSKNVLIFGASASRFDIDKSVIEIGRSYSQEEDQSLAQVALLGSNIAQDLFGDSNPLGNLIRIGTTNFEVIGVYEKKGGFAGDDDQVFIPVTTLQKKIMGIDYLILGVVELKDNNLADVTALDIADTLRRNHYITDPAKDDFKVNTQAESLSTFNVILQAVTFLLIAIASISLIVGGVGVMNIMYVAVTERIGEIGLKKALGARNRDILYEFVIEAILLTIIGGIVGVLGGSFLSFLVSKIAQNYGLSWQFIVPIWGVILAVSVSMIIGLIFGVFPAKNAARLNPIDALNKE